MKKKKTKRKAVVEGINISSNILKYWDTQSIGTPSKFVKIIIFSRPKNWDILKIAKIFNNFLYHMYWDSDFGPKNLI